MAPTTKTGGAHRPARLPYTGDDAADRLLAENPLAMLIGFVLDQQVTVQKAFAGPRVLLERVGTLDAGALARLDAAELEAAFRTPPAIHRFPGNMARRVQQLCAHVVEHYGGKAERIWTEAGDGPDLHRRLAALPGMGPMKVATLVRLLSRQYGIAPRGYEAFLPDHRTLGDVTTTDELHEYQQGKRAFKASLRAQGVDPSAHLRARQAAGGAGRAGTAEKAGAAATRPPGRARGNGGTTP